jgi:3-oxoacyl-[acyl-carrier protein] reductase
VSDANKLLSKMTAVITGCNRGIGRATLELFAEQGADIFACARRESDEFEQACREISARTGVSILPVYFDLEDEAQVRRGVKEIVGSNRRIDVLVNNAGIASGALLQMTSIKEMRRVFEVNFFAQVKFIQGLVRGMVRQRGGSIINLASTAGLIGDPGMTSYGSSKAALILATKTMASELGAMNIRVNAIAPSITRTEMYEQMEEEARERLIQNCALKRPAEAVEIANVALFLASGLSSFVTGQILRVDGGSRA